jgi:hypothetical protein
MPAADPTGGQTLPENSLARGRGQSPAERIANHNAKKRQADARRAGTPGPGSYSPARPAQVHGGSSKSGSVGGSASFASKTKRISDAHKDADQGDPGAYDPGVNKTLGMMSKKSASKNNRAGSGSFGTLQQRKIAIEIMGESTHGPGAYSGDNMLRSGKKAALSAMDTGERMPSSAFKSKSSKAYKYPNHGVPGAGAYTPMHTAIEKQTTNPGAAMKAKGQRFKGADTWERAQSAEPGPGSYETEILRTGSKSSLASLAISGGRAKEVRMACRPPQPTARTRTPTHPHAPPPARTHSHSPHPTLAPHLALPPRRPLPDFLPST